MNNEIGRKITSLTLMTIMLAGGMTVASSGMMPAAHAANANLFVSAENSQFDNYMSGPQVIEVVVIDSDINDTDQGKGEPDVTVNGKKLRMAQAIDGNWYGYFADKVQAVAADLTVGTTEGDGLDFGAICTAAQAATAIGPNFADTVGVAMQRLNAECADTAPDVNILNVVREAKILNGNNAANGGGATEGQILVDLNTEWPFIQLYTLSVGGNVIVQYNKGGGAQSVTLTFDTVEAFASASLDRAIYPQAAEVHATVTDLWLNIDPTDEDSWTFGTVGTFSTNYQVFDENGAAVGDTAQNTRITSGSLTDKLATLMCEDNCKLKTNPNVQGTGNVFTLQDNDDSAIIQAGGAQVPTNWKTAAGFIDAFVPVTITEQGPNSGVFGTYDESDKSNIIITNAALRGTSGFIEYNENKATILVGFDFATIDIQPIDDEWSSGEEIPIVLVDGDANKNSRADEDLDNFNPNVTIIPTLKTGNPFTLETTDDFFFITLFDTGDENQTTDNDALENILGATTDTNGAGITASFDFETAGTDYGYDSFSKRVVLNLDNAETIDLASTNLDTGADTIGSALVVAYTDRTLGDLKAVVRDTDNARTGAAADFSGYNFFNYDIRTVNENQIAAGHAVVETDIFLIIGNEADAANGGTAGTPVAINEETLDIVTTAASERNDFCLIDIATNAPLKGYIEVDADLIEAIYDADADNACTNDLGAEYADDEFIGVVFFLDDKDTDIAIALQTNQQPITVDWISFGFLEDGVQSGERVADQIVRLELEESGDNTSTFVGTLEYIMVNQLTIDTLATYTGLSTIDNEASFIVIEDLTDEDSLRISYLDLGADGVATQISDQEEAPSHSGVVSFDSNSYKIADTVTVTLEDADLNTDSDLIDIYTVVTADAAQNGGGNGNTYDMVGIATSQTLSFGELGRLLDITFNDLLWSTPDVNLDDVVDAGAALDNCRTNLTNNNIANSGLGNTGFTLVESAPASGVFVGDFQIPKQHCILTASSLDDGAVGYLWTETPVTTTGVDIEVNYVDFRDASGEIIEVGDSAGVRANTGSISLDRTVYPVPFGVVADFTASTGTSPAGDSLFAVHASGFNTATTDTIVSAGRTLASGDLTIHIRVNDPDFDISAGGEDSIAVSRGDSTTRGPVKISVIRGSNVVDIGFVGGPAAVDAKIGVGASTTTALIDNVREFGPMLEIAPDAGIFEADIPVIFTDGPSSALCPNPDVYRLLGAVTGSTVGNADPDRRFTPLATAVDTLDYCILQGDILQVEYEDPEDASGNANTVTDSATFDLRNGVLQSDKSVYIIGSDMILTLIEPDFDLDNDTAETYDLDLIEWDSDAATITMGNIDGELATFDPEPTDFRETGDSTGIFQIVIEIPEVLANDRLERGEEIILEFTDWGPSGADYIGQEKEDVNLTVFTSNFGATVELDQKVYTWTDKVYITIVAPDHNFDSDLVDTIGNTALDPVKVSTRGANIDRYSLVETGTDTGIFTGEVILVGFGHDADGKLTTGTADNGFDKGAQSTSADGSDTVNAGPTSGLLITDNDDGLTVSFEFSEDETVVGSSLIRWNIGEVQWLEASYPASGTGVVRVIDPDMNLNPEAVDNYTVDVWSDSDAGGIDLTVTETNEATGIFEGTVFFTVDDESSGHRLRVAEGDTVTAEYEDNTLPDPYTRADELDISATTLIGTIVPPLERAPAANLRTVDAFGNSLDTVSVDQQVQISADLANGQDRKQSFAYLVQIQDGNGVTVSLAWITGSLDPGQSFSPALSWIPTTAGTYTATAFVWESVDNPTALSPPVSTTVLVQ